MYIGDYTPGKTVTGKFNTHQANGTPITLAGTPALSVYKDSTTESTSGVTLTVDYDSRTGLHRFSIDTSADGTFYASGNNFEVVITTGTVDSISVVGTAVASFSLSNRSALRPTTADRTLDVSSGGEAGIDWANVGSPTTAVNLSGTNFDPDQVVASVTGNVGGNVTGSVGSVATGGIASASFAAGAINNAAMSIDGSELTAIPWNASWDAEVQSEVQDALVANNLDHLVLSAVDTDFATTVHLNSVLGQMADNGTSATFDRTTDSLEALANGSTPPTAAAIADAVWEEAIADHSGTSGSTAEALNAAGSAGDPWVTALPGSYTGSQAGKILADVLADTGTTLDGKLDTLTTRLGTPSDLGGGATIAANLADIEAQTDDIGSAGAGLTALATAAELAKVPKSDGTATWNATALASINAEADAALSDYGALKPTTAGRTLDVSAGGEAGIDWANVGGPTTTLALTGTTVGTVTTLAGHTAQTGDAYARLGAPAGASVSADVAAVKTDTGNLVTRVTSTLFSGITSLAQWLGLLAGKQTGNSTARTELRATGAGSGTFDETTDSVEALRDRGDAAWVTATGFSTLDAAGVRSAVGLATNNLDTQLAAKQATFTSATGVTFPTNFGSMSITVGGAVGIDGTSILTEDYPTLGDTTVPLAALLHSIHQNIAAFSISGTTVTVKKIDGTTTAETFTLDSATTPTSRARAT